MAQFARRYLYSMAAFLLLVGSALRAHAGGGPESLFLVVNANSWASVTVANQYIALRKIPPSNVYYLNWEGGFEQTTSEEFREKILTPAVEAMEKRNLYSQIDYLIYSSDLPSSVSLLADYSDEIKATLNKNKQSQLASLNSATYLWHLIAARSPAVFNIDINRYMRNFVNGPQKIDRQVGYPSHGFQNWYGWQPDGTLMEGGGQPYLLSTMLAVTSGRGNSVGEVTNYLRRSAGADGTFPKGTIYFTRTSDVRSATRQDEVAGAIAELNKLGVPGQVVTTPMPMRAPDVLGLISGVEDFSWPATGSTILPGAICDNFTSFGGIIREDSSQTPLTEFLRYGAAGSAGTVIEPWSFAQKFASPNIFVHYARGCSLAESYYQSLFAPTQVLIVGDPLCQPWANIPSVTVEGIKPSQTVSGTLTLKPQASFPREGKVARYTLYVDGRRAAAVNAGEDLIWDSASESDGFHELSVVATEDGPIETQGRTVFPISIDNHGHSAVMATRPDKSVQWGEVLQVAVRATKAKRIFVLNNGRLLGTINGQEGSLKVDPRVLGLGPVEIQSVALFGSGPLERVVAKPVNLTVGPGAPKPALPSPGDSLLPGLILKLANGRLVPVQDTRDAGWLSANGVGAGQPFAFDAYFNVPATDVYQFQLWHTGDLQLAIDRQPLYRARDGKNDMKFVPIALAEGLHRVTVNGNAGSDVKLRILFGGPGTHSLNGQTFRHPKQ